MTENISPIEALSLPGNRTIGAYSDVMKVGRLLFLSGRVGLDYADMQLVEGGIGEQTRQCLAKHRNSPFLTPRHTCEASPAGIKLRRR